MRSSATASTRVASAGRRRPVSASRPAFARRRRVRRQGRELFRGRRLGRLRLTAPRADDSGGGDGDGTSTARGGDGGGDDGSGEQQRSRSSNRRCHRITPSPRLLSRGGVALLLPAPPPRCRRHRGEELRLRASDVREQAPLAIARRTGGVDCFKGVICSTFIKFSLSSRNSRWPKLTRFFDELRRLARGLLASESS